MPYRIAFTDIHANRTVLTPPLTCAAAPDLILVGGDLTYKPAYPRETFELLATVEHQAVSGNTDIYVTEWATPDAPPDWRHLGWAQPHARWTREQIGATWAARTSPPSPRS
ncbi:MAG: metallophosphoesterase family protein [Thermomicrobiales bacterium]